MVVHGAAGGVGTATLQVAKAWGAHTIGVVSSDAKEEVARQAGADEVVRADGPWRDEVKAMTDGGAHMVLDPVGGDRFTDSLRCLREGGRVVVVGFTGGSIPEVRVNRLLLNNTEVIGAGLGRLRARLARAHRAHRPRHRGDDRVRPGPPDRRGPLPAGAGRRTRSSSWTGAAPPARSFSTSSRRPRSLASSGAMYGPDRALPRAPSLRRRRPGRLAGRGQHAADPGAHPV